MNSQVSSDGEDKGLKRNERDKLLWALLFCAKNKGFITLGQVSWVMYSTCNHHCAVT